MAEETTRGIVLPVPLVEATTLEEAITLAREQVELAVARAVPAPTRPTPSWPELRPGYWTHLEAPG